MKRFPFLFLGGFFSLILAFQYLCERRARAESTDDPRPKLSRDILEKVAAGKGADLIRVIIQPADQLDSDLDSSIETAGGSNVRRYQNFRARVVTLSANAALVLSTKKQISYISLNREVRTLG